MTQGVKLLPHKPDYLSVGPQNSFKCSCGSLSICHPSAPTWGWDIQTRQGLVAVSLAYTVLNKRALVTNKVKGKDPYPKMSYDLYMCAAPSP